MGSVIFQEMAGVRGRRPILFFSLIRTSSTSTHLKQYELKVRKIMQTSFFSICVFYISAVLLIFVFFQPNFQDMLAIAQSTCAINFIFLSASLLLLDCFQIQIMVKIYTSLFTFLWFENLFLRDFPLKRALSWTKL